MTSRSFGRLTSVPPCEVWQALRKEVDTRLRVRKSSRWHLQYPSPACAHIINFGTEFVAGSRARA